jgi:hypothetical protein
MLCSPADTSHTAAAVAASTALLGRRLAFGRNRELYLDCRCCRRACRRAHLGGAGVHLHRASEAPLERPGASAAQRGARRARRVRGPLRTPQLAAAGRTPRSSAALLARCGEPELARARPPGPAALTFLLLAGSAYDNRRPAKPTRQPPAHLASSLGHGGVLGREQLVEVALDQHGDAREHVVEVLPDVLARLVLEAVPSTAGARTSARRVARGCRGPRP